jgi:hypothetical protein
MSVFQHTSKARGKVLDKQKEYKDSFARNEKGNYHFAKTRRNAYATVSSAGGTYDALYSNEEGKPDVILESVIIKEAADFGMLRTLEWKFTCLNRATFIKYEKAFMRPKTTVNASIGYVNGDDSDSFRDFTVAKWSFNLNDKNQYVCSCKAYGPGPFMQRVEMDKEGSFGNKKITVSGFFSKPVSTLPMYLKWTAQNEGVMANVDIPNWSHYDGNGVVVIDNPNGITPSGFIGKAVYKILQAIGLFSSDASKKIYCTLEWLVAAMNTYYLGNNLGGKLKGRTLVCNGTVTKGAHPIKEIGSAYPMMLVLKGGGAGNYGSGMSWAADDEVKINFDGNAKAGDVVPSGDYSKILISYEYIASKMFGGGKEKGTSDKSGVAAKAAQQTDGLKESPKLSLSTVMDTLFSDIYHATGGAVQLAMIENPDNSQQQLVVARNGEQKDIKETVFKPIDGDGITRKCSITCDPPADAAYAVMNGGSSNSYATNNIATEPDPSAEETPKNKALTTIKEQMEKGLSASSFDNEDCDALASAFKTLVETATEEQATQLPDVRNCWPLKLEIEIDGTSGFRFGDCVNADFMPGAYTESGVAPSFVVTSAEQEVKGNDWVTKLNTIMRLTKKS